MLNRFWNTSTAELPQKQNVNNAISIRKNTKAANIKPPRSIFVAQFNAVKILF